MHGTRSIRIRCHRTSEVFKPYGSLSLPVSLVVIGPTRPRAPVDVPPRDGCAYPACDIHVRDLKPLTGRLDTHRTYKRSPGGWTFGLVVILNPRQTPEDESERPGRSTFSVTRERSTQSVLGSLSREVRRSGMSAGASPLGGSRSRGRHVSHEVR